MITITNVIIIIIIVIIIIIIIIIVGKFIARAWLWLQDDASQFYLVNFSNLSER